MKATESAKAIIRWQYFCYNHGPIENIIKQVFPESLHNHLLEKFYDLCENTNDTAVVWSRFFMELSTTNQILFSDWVNTNYKGIESKFLDK